MSKPGVVLFCHSMLSDWKNSEASFLRGVATELAVRGHGLRIFEPLDASSLHELVNDQGLAPLNDFQEYFPLLLPERFSPESLDLVSALADTELVLVAEGTEPGLVKRIGEHRRQSSHYRLLYHDSQHRQEPDLCNYDGALVAGKSLAEWYERRGLAQRTWTWPAAADVRIFKPQQYADSIGDLVWSGTWDSEARNDELREFLLRPIAELGLDAEVYGPRYSRRVQEEVERAGAGYRGWVASFLMPALYSRFRATVHLPRRALTQTLPGIPSAHLFEALACGLPVVSAPWHDLDELFRPGRDYLLAEDGVDMVDLLRRVLDDVGLADELAQAGRRTILEHHTCGHRVDELIAIHHLLSPG